MMCRPVCVCGYRSLSYVLALACMAYLLLSLCVCVCGYRSLSYVLALACMAYLLLSVCYLLVDVYRVWSGAPFFYTGM